MQWHLLPEGQSVFLLLFPHNWPVTPGTQKSVCQPLLSISTRDFSRHEPACSADETFCQNIFSVSSEELVNKD